MKMNGWQVTVVALIIILLIVLALWLLGSHETQFLGQSLAEQEVPAPTLPPGVSPKGDVNASLAKDQKSLTWHANVAGTSGPVTVAHFHQGPMGVAGPIVKTLPVRAQGSTFVTEGTWSSTDATEPLTPSLVQDLLNNRIYINWHTALNPNGEARGQLFH